MRRRTRVMLDGAMFGLAFIFLLRLLGWFDNLPALFN